MECLLLFISILSVCLSLRWLRKLAKIKRSMTWTQKWVNWYIINFITCYCMFKVFVGYLNPWKLIKIMKSSSIMLLFGHFCLSSCWVACLGSDFVAFSLFIIWYLTNFLFYCCFSWFLSCLKVSNLMMMWTTIFSQVCII